MIIDDDRIRITRKKGTSRPIDPVEPKPRRDFFAFIRLKSRTQVLLHRLIGLKGRHSMTTENGTAIRPQTCNNAW